MATLISADGNTQLQVDDGLIKTIEEINAMTDSGPDVMINLLLGMFARLVNVCAPALDEDIVVDQSLVDRIVVAAHVGATAIAAGQDYLSILKAIESQEVMLPEIDDVVPDLSE